MKGSIFFSYAGVDRDAATRFAEGLRGAGVDVWWDQGEDDIGWGDNWIDKLQETLSSCSAYLILVGPSGIRRWVKAELSIALRRHFETGLPIFPALLHGVAPDSLPPFLSIFQTQSLPEALDQIDFGKLAKDLQTTAGAEGGGAVIGEGICPFPGLEAFNEDDASFFFGRQSETLDALRRLGPGLDGVYRRWLQIEGPSGVGKSSLVRAGLVPAIKRGWIEEDRQQGARRWHVAPPMRPGVDPMENLAEVLSKAGDLRGAPSLGELVRELRKDGQALRHLLRQDVPEGDGFVLVVDQLEEVFTLTNKAEDRAQFDALLAEAVKDLDSPLHLITTIRSDFMLRFRDLPRLEELLNESAGRYLLRSMTEAGLRDVVRTPARLAGLHWSDDALPDEIVGEAIAEPGALPLVGNLLRLLWNERDDHVLTAAAYRQLGGLGGALAGRADQLLDSLGPDGKERARKLLLGLVEPGRKSEDSRRTITREMALDAAGHGPQAEVVLDRLSGLRDATTSRGAQAMPRLVVVSGNQEEENDQAHCLVDLAHEALLRDDRRGEPYWRTLRDWVETYRKQLEDRRLIEILAEKWQERGRSWRSEELARGRQLRDFDRIDSPVSELADAYLRASQRLWWLRSSVIGALVVVVSMVAGFGWWINQENITLRVGSQLLALKFGLGGPEMVELSGETFFVGSPEGEGDDDERPQHEVTVPAFAIGKYEVTFAEWDLCFAAGGCSHRPSDNGWGRAVRPMIDVSWDDAQEYVAWLSEVTGDTYRLPTEAEWEYAARAGTTTQYAFGDEITSEQAKFDEAVGETTEVGSYPPNVWGLHDMHGNVWEWVEDCWNGSYAGAPTDGSAWVQEGCSARVLRGGSWINRPELLRSAIRSRDPPVLRDLVVGFRLARTCRIHRRLRLEPANTPSPG